MKLKLSGIGISLECTSLSNSAPKDNPKIELENYTEAYRGQPNSM
jgi:hypothetical protein